MDTLVTTFQNTGTLHHAYCFIGDAHLLRDSVRGFITETVGIDMVQNPDIYDREYDVCGVDDVFAIQQSEQSQSFVPNARKIFIISTNSITEQAQNSLLKILEEPRQQTHFFIILPQDMLLPTLRSRVQMVAGHSGQVNTDTAVRVLQMNMGKRMEWVKELADSIKDEKAEKQDAIDMVNQIERVFYDRGIAVHHAELSACQRARESLYDNGAPVKMILEQLLLGV